MTDIDRLRHDDGSPAPYAIVEEFWPYDGPRDPHFTSSAAAAMAHLVRYLNNSTQYREGLSNAPVLGRVVSSLSSAVYGLDQLLQQLTSAAERLAEDPTLYDDQRPHEQGRTTALDLACELVAIRYRLRDLQPLLDRANGFGGRLGHRSEGGS